MHTFQVWRLLHASFVFARFRFVFAVFRFLVKSLFFGTAL